MSDRQQDAIKLQPHMIPSIRQAFANSLGQLNDALIGLRREGNLVQPWLGDMASQEVVAHYMERAMNGPESSYQALVAYRDEVGRVHDTLHQMESDYRRTEGENAALWGGTV